MNHKDLEVWKKSIEFVSTIYSMTNGKVEETQNNITKELRRSVSSIPSDIADGCSASDGRETINYLNNSLDTLSKIDNQLLKAESLNYIKNSGVLIDKSMEIRDYIIELIDNYNY